MNRKFGVEMEIVGISRDKALAAFHAVGITAESENYNHTTRRHWKLVPDGSVHGGFEVVSPILEGEAGLNELQTVANALDDAGATANRACGLHVHFDASGLTVEHIRKIVTRYATYEPQIDAFMPASRRGNNNRYCSSIQGLAGESLFCYATTLQELINAQPGRYFKVNLQSFMAHGTIEFRQHSGTVNAAKVTNWVRFLSDFIAASVALANASASPASQAVPVVPVIDLPRVSGIQRDLANFLAQGAASVFAICQRFGWQAHSARAAVCRLRRAGLAINSVRVDGQAAYALAQATPATPVTPVSHAPASCSAAEVLPDTLFAGVSEAVARFYINRAAVFATAA